MNSQQDMRSFIEDSKSILQEYIETRLEIFRLQSVKVISRSAGYFIWIMLSLFLLFFIFLFAGLVLGYWLSSITGSLTSGFGITTLIMLFVFGILAIFRKPLFINPVIKGIVGKAMENNNETRK